jgi:hypothetical protein
MLLTLSFQVGHAGITKIPKILKTKYKFGGNLTFNNKGRTEACREFNINSKIEKSPINFRIIPKAESFSILLIEFPISRYL